MKMTEWQGLLKKHFICTLDFILISVLTVDKTEQSLLSKQSYTLITNIGLKSLFIHFLTDISIIPLFKSL